MAANEYEEARRLMLEENKKRMEELGLVDVMAGFTPRLSKSPTGKAMKQKRSPSEAEVLASRRSARTAGKPKVDYKLSIAADRYIGCTPADIAIIEAVDEALAKLTNPAFVRHVLYSYGAGSFHAYIPLDFRKNYLPEKDEWFTLEDEDRMEWSSLYDAKAGDVRNGWRDFSLHHALMAGDCCIFELVSPSRFRVQIFRYDGYNDGGSRKKLEPNGKKVVGKGPQKEKMSSSRKYTVSEEKQRLIDRKRKLEAITLENYRRAERREARLSIRIDLKPKLEAEPREENQGVFSREAQLWKPIGKKPKLEAEPPQDYRSADPQQARLSSRVPARRGTLRSAVSTVSAASAARIRTIL